MAKNVHLARTSGADIDGGLADRAVVDLIAACGCFTCQLGALALQTGGVVMSNVESKARKVRRQAKQEEKRRRKELRREMKRASAAAAENSYPLGERVVSSTTGAVPAS